MVTFNSFSVETCADVFYFFATVLVLRSRFFWCMLISLLSCVFDRVVDFHIKLYQANANSNPRPTIIGK